MPNTQLDEQLRETCQLTRSGWAVWLEEGSEWEAIASYKVNVKQRKQLVTWIQQPGNKDWLKAVSIGKPKRMRNVPEGMDLQTGKIYIFPDPVTQRAILVGAEVLTDIAQRFWKVVSIGTSGRSYYDPYADSQVSGFDIFPYHQSNALNKILNMFLQTANCQGGWLAVRSGDYLEIKVQSNCDDCQNTRLSIDANPLLRELMRTKQLGIYHKGDPDWVMVPPMGFSKTTRTWIALPLIIGQRMIGLVGQWTDESAQQIDVEKIKQLSIRLAPSVEGSITFTDLSNHLHRMGLLNDFALTIASSLDLDQIIQRVFALLRRAFNTERINLVVLSSDGSEAQSYFEREGLIVSHTEAHFSLPKQVEKGEVYRTDINLPESEQQINYPGSRSSLVVPLKYRKQVIGAVGLESMKDGAFSVYDEHLLVVIASYLAGLLENGRLRRDAEARARNLSLIHEVVEQVISLTDVRQVAQIAAELMAKNFDYELAGVALATGPNNDLQVVGLGGNAADLVQKGLPYLNSVRASGIVMKVAASGQSVLENNVTKNPIYLPIPDWEAGSEMCVALKESDRVIGVINVESRRTNAFSQNDLLVLESLAGILASVIIAAGQYQKLQATIVQLQAAREELQERISAQHTAESRLIQAAKLAAVGEMAAGIAHELNNPLTTVSGFTELSLDGLPVDSPIRSDLEMVLREAKRARDVVRRLLDFARQNESVRTKTEFNEIVEDVIALVNHLLHTSGVQLITDLTANLPWVALDRNQIKQVILNLIHNALHAMPEGGQLRITTRCVTRDKQNWLQLTVNDTGTGITPENLDRIFEPFFTTRAKDGGTGLGLSVSYGIVAEHGGFMEAESKQGKGSTFSIWLPVE